MVSKCFTIFYKGSRCGRAVLYKCAEHFWSSFAALSQHFPSTSEHFWSSRFMNVGNPVSFNESALQLWQGQAVHQSALLVYSNAG
mmetsp:Transcript_38652/g.122872  ORF Transcript_38652/g.122872 Transcript_38652/m.122872 type:complete len:85 (-) Transcript_38652:40-294(-)